MAKKERKKENQEKPRLKKKKKNLVGHSFLFFFRFIKIEHIANNITEKKKKK